MTYSTPYRVVLSALAYFATQSLAFQLPESFGLVASIWPAAGVALAALLLNPKRLWPVLLGALFVTGLVANLLTDRHHLAIVGFMVANICETAASAWLITWWCGETIRFDCVKQVIALAVAAFLVNGGTSLLGAGSASLAQGSNFWTFYWTWYVADGLGMLLITPLIVVWARSQHRGGSMRWKPILETSGIIALGGLTAWLAFGPRQIVGEVEVIPSLVWVILMWAALRTGTAGTATFLNLVALTAVGFTATGHSAFPLGGADTAQRLLAVQVFLGMLGLTGLLLAAAVVQSRASHALLNAVVEGTSDAVYAKDLQGRYLLINRAAARVVGETPANVIGHDDTFYFSPEEALAVMKSDQAAMASAGPMTYEEPVTDKSGKRHTFLATKGPIHTEEGEVTGIFGISRDITARVETEQALREMEEKYRSVVERATDGITIIQNGVFVFANPTFANMSGYAREELDGLDFLTMVAPEDRRLIAERVAQRLAGEHPPANYQIGLYRKDGSSFTVDVSAGLITYRNAPADLVIVRDVTGRNEAEAALRATEERFRVLFDRANDGILILSPTGAVVSANEAFARMHGYTTEEVSRLDLRVLDVPETYRAMPEKMQQILSGQSLRFEVEHRHKDGHIFPLEVSASLMIVEGQPLVQAFHRDITDRKHAEQLLQSSLREKQSLLKEVHHRVKNNLQVVASLMRLEGAQHSEAGVKEMLGNLQGRVQSMALMHEMLYQVGMFAAVDLGDYLKRLTTQIVQMLVVRPGAIGIHVDVAPVQIEMDLATPCGLLVNELLTNSFKHAFPDNRAGEVRVELQLVDGGPQVRLCVSDTGVGLPADFEQRRLQSLGMQLVSDLAGQLGGKLRITSDHGTSVSVTFLPRRPGRDGVSANPEHPA